MLSDPENAQQHSRDESADLAVKPALDVNAPRILVLSPSPSGTGGIEGSTRSLLSALADLYGPEQVGVLPVWRIEGEPSYRVLSRRWTPKTHGSGSVRWHVRLGYVWAAVRTARRWKRSLVVIATHPHLASVAWMCSLVSGASWATWCHGQESWGELPKGLTSALRQAKVVFAPSQFTADQVSIAAGLPPGSVRVIRHCVPNANPLLTLDGGSFLHPTVLTVARLSERDAYKGVDALLYAWPLVRAELPRARLVIVGEGGDKERLQRIAEVLGADGSVQFTGRLDNHALCRAYANADLFALPGRFKLGSRPEGEGFGLVFLEAGAAGLPVIGGKGAGTEEAVLDGTTGILVDPDDPTEVSRAVIHVITRPDLARRLGEAGRRRVREEFSYELFRDELGKLVHELSRAQDGAV